MPTRDSQFLGLAAVAQRLSLSPRTIRKWVRNPDHPLPAYRIGGKLLFEYENEVVGWIKKFRVEPRSWSHVAKEIYESVQERESKATQ